MPIIFPPPEAMERVSIQLVVTFLGDYEKGNLISCLPDFVNLPPCQPELRKCRNKMNYRYSLWKEQSLPL